MYVFLSTPCECWTNRVLIWEIVHFMHGAVAKRGKQLLGLEALGRDLERGKPLRRRKRGKVRNLDDSGGKDLADFNRSIFIAGIMHCVHNCCLGLAAVLPFWGTFIDHLKHVTRLVSRKYSKNRLIASCFDEMPNAFYASAIRAFRANVYDNRWGTALHALLVLIPIETPLRLCWCRRKYQAAGADVRQANDDDGNTVRVDVADNAIRSKLFWGYACFCDRIAFVMLLIISWADDCPCHFIYPDDDTLNKQDRQKLLTERTKLRTCPMSGCWVPWLANGEILTMVRRLLASSGVALLLSLAERQLSAAEQAIVMEDFDRVRRYIYFTFSVKFGHWQQLPWVTAGIGHPDYNIAVACCRRALALFDHDPDAEHHWLSLLLCAVPHLGREQMLAFSSRVRVLHELPLLNRIAARWRFA